MEIRPLPRNPNYGVTRCGKVFRIVRARFGQPVPHELAQTAVGRKGYLNVGNGSGRGLPTVHVHRAVAETYIPNPDNLPEVAHEDGVNTRNVVENLRWSTHTDNRADRLKHGTTNRGSRHGAHKLTESDVKALRGDRANAGVIAASRGASEKHVRAVQNGKDWPHV